ncbi:hypothetical protein [Planococcus lenghuensis]|uniref:S1 motif domain-containing protein n=1 Tax=Planococcus lenghuensis TaxID=2213202 RepID=A0A1Q2L4G4_9BACL|nr:hypothetical protein [Planococcus lenghuensis]AQQ55348.1 hypothetical protein B0X71_19435 [Planococcus lenghuensis]
MVVKSWSNDHTLEELTKAHRTRQLITGVIRSIKEMQLPAPAADGSVKVQKTDTLVVALPGGVTGYCPSFEFREHKFRSYARFVGTKERFVITRLDLENKVAYLSGLEADSQLADELWQELSEREAAGTLAEKDYPAIVNGINAAKGIIHLRFRGQDAFMFRSEWSWNDREAIDADVGETIYVKILKVDTANRLVKVSRKATLTDPMDFLNQLKQNDIIAGRVTGVSSLHGIFVEIENGVVLKGTLPRRLEDPEEGDIVTCRVSKVDAKKRRGRVVIIDYPQGKRKKKDVGSFLFED